MRQRVRPAYVRLAGTLEQLKQTASDVPGVWTLPDGDAYYAAVLALHVHPDVDAEALHREGRAEVDALTLRLEAALDQYEADEEAVEVEADPAPARAALTEESEPAPPLTVAQRLAVLAMRPDQVFEPTPEGRAALMAEIDRVLAIARRDTPRFIAHMPDLPVSAALTSDGERLHALAVYSPPSPDGRAPGLFLIDASDPARLPRYEIPALVLHETVPGHHTEAAFAIEVADLPLIRQLMWVTGYGEGWATYAETLGMETGLFEAEPLAEIGILKSQLFSAARMVSDTGLHHMRWSREEAVDYLMEATGIAREAAEFEVNRIVVWPGQAAAYTGGALQIRTIRARARAVVGDDFDLAAFHYTILSGGPRPLAQVERDLERWYEAQMTGR